MKITNMFAAAIISSALLVAGCTKEGAQGPAGSNGTNGINGNANVRAFIFQNDSVKATQDFRKTLSLSSGYIDSSLVLAYFVDHDNPTSWYIAPGLGLNNTYQTKFYTFGGSSTTDFILRVLSPTGSTYANTVLLDKVKVVVVPISSFGKKDPVDYSDYRATMQYLGLKE